MSNKKTLIIEEEEPEINSSSLLNKPITLSNSLNEPNSIISNVTSSVLPTPTIPSVSLSYPNVIETKDIEDTKDILKKNENEISNNVELKKLFDSVNCEGENLYSKGCNQFLLKKELVEREYLEKNSSENDYLYPNLNDPNFILKIAEKKEFNDTQYDGKIHPDVKEYADALSKMEFELSPHQAFVRNFLSSQTPYNSLLLYHGLGSGKCHAKGTQILMFDGSIKLVEDIIQGDFLMGDDSTPRKVLSLANGIDKMYDIIYKNGNKYRVNKEHILCLREKFKEDITEISVEDYIQLPKSQKNILNGYKVSVEFDEKKVDVDPYEFGLTLFKTNKNIPNDYKLNSKHNRLKLLAGIIDGIGNISFDLNQIEIILDDPYLVKDVVFLIRSLGFAISVEKSETFEYEYLISISGKLENIPMVKVKYFCSDINIDYLTYSIDVKYIKEEEYYGFTLDGNGRYLMGDFTVTHNTCSAIGVCEENRDYSKQVGLTKRIIIVASKNVQDNFRLQLFDERKLKNIDGIWNIKGCVGNKLLKEINPSGVVGLTREKIISQIKGLINNAYLFLGYGQFANYIIKTASIESGTYNSDKEKMNRAVKQLRTEFDGRLIVIDEVHNIRMTEDNENKFVALNLELLVKSANNLRLLLLSATPMYNSYKEIVWLINLMNINDRRGTVSLNSIFNKNGEMKDEGKEILIRKATGYISFVRGENPYTFPYRIYPTEFAINNSKKKNILPTIQMNGKSIENSNMINILDLYLLNIGKIQKYGYEYIVNNLKSKNTNITTKKGEVRIMPSFEDMEKFGYTLLQKPLEALIIVYPYDGLEKVDIKEAYKKEEQEETPTLHIPTLMNTATKTKSLETTPELNITNRSSTELSISSFKGGNYIDPNELTGKEGLKRIMNFKDEKNPPEKGSFEYKSNKYGNIFSPGEIGKYSCKIKNILDSIVSPDGLVSDGIILIYSQYIDGGLIPVALALEEMGFVRYGSNSNNLFKVAPSPKVDVRTMKPKSSTTTTFLPARYTMITGDVRLSPNNDYEINGLTGDDNKNGEKIKVVLISKAGSEGIDLKFIRQVHILEPWYNMNRIEQIIGRAVRNFSHKDLPFEKRNVEIFMYATLLEDKNRESADIYVYRVAEYKAIQIGIVSRLLKETSVDCIINYDQTNFTREIMEKANTIPIKQILSNGMVINDFKIGDLPFSPACDYMETCQYTCHPQINKDEIIIKEDTYNEAFIMINLEKVIQKIKMLMKENYFYKKKVLLELIDIPKVYPLVQKYAALTQLIEDNNEFITDKYGRTGHLINIDDYYLFQPNELKYKNISIFDRSVPIDYKRNIINFELKKNIEKEGPNEINNLEEIQTSANLILDNLKEKYNLAIEYESPDKIIKRGEDNWYKYCGVAIRRLVNGGMKKKILDELLIDHLLDSLLLNEKKDILNYLYSSENTIYNDTFEEKAMEYFRRTAITFKNMYNSKNTSTILMYNIDKKEEILILNDETSKWKIAEPEDIREILEATEVKNKWIIKNNELNTWVGFMGYEKQNRYLVFKIKDIKSKRNSGARCDEGGKAKTLKILNEVVGEERYTSESTKGLVQIELCCLLELIMRYYNRLKINNKIWFLNSDIALFNKF
jgi:hypothetical protein